MDFLKMERAFRITMEISNFKSLRKKGKYLEAKNLFVLRSRDQGGKIFETRYLEIDFPEQKNLSFFVAPVRFGTADFAVR